MKAAIAAVALAGLAWGQESHTSAAVRLMQARRYGEAEREFAAAMKAEPGNGTLRLQFATCLFIEERNEEARREFETARRELGESPGIAYYLGLLDLRASNYAEAIGNLKPLGANPVFPKAAYYLGLAYLGAGETAAAMANLERAAKNNPREPDVHYRLGRLYSAAGRGEDADREYGLYRSAREAQRVVEQEAPACMDALKTQAAERAREICGRIADPADARRMLLLGQLYADAGKFTDAIDPLTQAAKLEPDSFEAAYYLGLDLYGLKRYADARGPLEKAVALNPQYFDAVNLLAKALYAAGDYRAALPVLERAHDLNPADAQLAGVLERLRAALKAQ